MRHLLFFVSALAALVAMVSAFPVQLAGSGERQEVIDIHEQSSTDQSSNVDGDVNDDLRGIDYWGVEGSIDETVLRLVELVESLPSVEDGTSEYVHVARLTELVSMVQTGSCGYRELGEIQYIADILSRAGERFSVTKEILNVVDEIFQQLAELESVPQSDFGDGSGQEDMVDGDFEDSMTKMLMASSNPAEQPDNEGDAEDDMDWVTLV